MPSDKDVLSYDIGNARFENKTRADAGIAEAGAAVAAHAIGGASHSASTLASLSGKVSDATLANKITMIDGPLSPQILIGAELSDGTDAGTLKVAELSALLRNDTDTDSSLTYIELVEQDNLEIEFADIRYYAVLDYNGGAPQILVLADCGNGTTQICIGEVMKDGVNHVHWCECGMRLQSGVAKLARRANDLRDVELASGLTISDGGGATFDCTEGIVYHGIVKSTPYAGTSFQSDVDEFTYVHGDSNADFTFTPNRTVIDLVQYWDPVAHELDDLVVNQYACHWVYCHPDDEHMYVMLGEGSNKLAEALIAQPTSDLPPELEHFSVLVGCIIIKKNTAIFAEIQMVTDKVFLSKAAVDHNAGGGLQGGILAERYHQTALQHTQSIILDKLNATVPPTVNDDVDEGYSVGSRWFDVTHEKAYCCLDATDGAAVWTEITGGGAAIERVSQQVQPTPDTGAFIIWHDPDDDAVRLLYKDTVAGIMAVELSSSPEPGWSPLNLEDLVLFYDLDMKIVIDGANLIEEVGDRSLSGCDLVQAVDANKYLLVTNELNGHDIMRGDGTADNMTGCNFNTLIGDNADGTLYVVFKCDNGGGRDESVFRAVIGNNEISIHPKWGDGSAYYTWGDIGGGARCVWNATVGNWQIGSMIRDGSNITAYVNDVQKGQVASNAYTSPAAAVVVGAFSPSSRWFAGNIAMVVLTNSAHDSTVHTQVNDYLKARFTI